MTTDPTILQAVFVLDEKGTHRSGTTHLKFVNTPLPENANIFHSAYRSGIDLEELGTEFAAPFEIGQQYVVSFARHWTGHSLADATPLAGMRRFILTGAKYGEGKVAEGCVFSDGSVAVRWQRPDHPNSSVWWASLADAEHVHTGIGHWAIEFLD